MFKKFVSILCAVALSTSFAVGSTVSAAVIPPDAPTYSYTREAYSNLTISGTTAICESSLTGYPSTTRIEVYQYLQKKNSSDKWENVATWYSDNSGYQCTVTNNAYSLSSGTYRLKTTFYVYSGGSSETVFEYSPEMII